MKNIHDPTVTAFPADASHNSGTAIVILPGGAHEEIVWTSEGINAARAFNRMGISVFVVKYRLAREDGQHAYSVERDETADVRRAMQWVRAHAGYYNIDPHRIGLMGFSAGGELVGMLADYGMTGAPCRRRPARPRQLPSRLSGSASSPVPARFGGRCRRTRRLRFWSPGARTNAADRPQSRSTSCCRRRAFRPSCTCTPTQVMRLILTSSNRISILHWPDRLYDWLADSGFLDGAAASALAFVIGVNISRQRRRSSGVSPLGDDRADPISKRS